MVDFRARPGCGTTTAIKEDDTMRTLSTDECRQVAGGHDVCTPADAMNDFYGIQNTTTFGQDLVNIYEGLVFATSHTMERVFSVFDD
jgi:hypothetical protein